MLPPDGIPHGKTVPPTLHPRRNAPPVLKFKIPVNDGMDVPKLSFPNGEWYDRRYSTLDLHVSRIGVAELGLAGPEGNGRY